MATLVDDSSTPPSYATIFSANPIQCDQSSVFSSRRMKKKCTAVLSRIRDIVLGHDLTPECMLPNILVCAAALGPGAEFFKILLKRNIKGHTALYWVIVNNRLQVFWALHEFTYSYYSPVCKDDLRNACMITSNHAIFSQLALGIRSEDMRFRRFLGCPSDQIQVHTCDESANQFNVVLRIGMFQKRLRATATSDRGDIQLIHEFVAGGHIWWLHFHMPEFAEGLWRVDIGLCWRSHPAACLNAVLVIEAHNRKSGSATPPEALKIPLSLADTKFVALTSGNV
ncbi:uncharacterized protein F5147DRAFT_780569 [Suillus discolor]|uniref:Uncharacterized protein n=1 Tax=Suillus discolor TaxID=1912936 RepID=A0A9P7EUW8_9AGAM|nr:uncharacterized protein F5147DRAFT_780569 [Suillus discolor]KAG2089615.1 hypothetical protein F5147DRAFT_780569 [Suillus discolor]